jgi:hypothetical protein
MGGRYGGSTDGSSDYQSRQPDDDDLSDEQQTVADAVHAVADQHQDDTDDNGEAASEGAHNDSESGGDTTSQSERAGRDNSGQHPLTAFGGSSANSGLDALADIDEEIADHVAKRLTERVRETVEGTDPNDSE